jgi:hypothetical protein
MDRSMPAASELHLDPRACTLALWGIVCDLGMICCAPRVPRDADSPTVVQGARCGRWRLGTGGGASAEQACRARDLGPSPNAIPCFRTFAVARTQHLASPPARASQRNPMGLQAAELSEGDRNQMVERVACDGAFIAIGREPASGFLRAELQLDERGYVAQRDAKQQVSALGRPLPEGSGSTSVDGVFACGDVADTRYRQAVTAAGAGAQAAMDADEYLTLRGL